MRRATDVKRTKYPAIEAAYKRYRGEDAAAETISCPGCGLAFTPEQKSEEAAPEQKSEATPPPAEQPAPADGLKRAAERAKEYRDRARQERGARRPVKTLAQITREYYSRAAEPAEAEDVIKTSSRGGK